MENFGKMFKIDKTDYTIHVIFFSRMNFQDFMNNWVNRIYSLKNYSKNSQLKLLL